MSITCRQEKIRGDEVEVVKLLIVIFVNRIHVRGPICGYLDLPVRADHLSNFSEHTTRVSARNKPLQTVAHCTQTNYSLTYLPPHNTTT